mgnify:CR=1 FL=1
MYVSLPRQNCLLNDVSNGSIFINFYHTADILHLNSQRVFVCKHVCVCLLYLSVCIIKGDAFGLIKQTFLIKRIEPRVFAVL